MNTYEFSVILQADDVSDDALLDIADRLGEHGCLDASVSCRADGVEVAFDREASSLAEAMHSAIQAVHSAGQTVLRLELQPDQVAPAG